MEKWPRMRVFYALRYSVLFLAFIIFIWLAVPIYHPSDPLWRRALMAVLISMIFFGAIILFRRLLWLWCANGNCEPCRKVTPGISEYLLAFVALVMLGNYLVYIVSLFKNFSEVYNRRDIFVLVGCMIPFHGFFPAIRWGAQWDEEGLHVGKGPLRSFYHWGSISKVTFIRYDDFSDKILSFKLFFVDGNYKLFKAVRGPRKTPAFVKSFYNECLRRRIPVDYEHDKYFDKNFSLDEVFEKRAE